MPKETSVKLLRSLRREIEVVSIRNIINRLTETDIKDFERVIDSMNESVRMKDVQSFIQQDIIFHSLIVKKYDDSHIYPIWKSIIDRTPFDYSRLTNLRESSYEHENIFRALKEGNSIQAEEFLFGNII